jgi:hypothetical protein
MLSINADVRNGLSAPGRDDLSDVDTTAPGFHQENLVGLFGETQLI